MGRKVFLIDIDRCNGCHNCQLACKDEHCEVDWMPYAKAQPITGQFWWKVEQHERGSIPKVKVSYIPRGCMHCDDCAGERVCDAGAFYRRDDGFIIIDPEKCTGCMKCVTACPYDAVFANDKLKIAQKCTGCAHLLDDDWAMPRCVDACVMQALQYVDIDALEYAEQFAAAECIKPELGTSPQVYYLNFPKRFIGGEVFDEVDDEVIIGATVTLAQGDKALMKVKTDDFGDFWFNQIAPEKYTVYVESEGYMNRVFEVDVTERDQNIGSIALYVYEGENVR